MKKFLEWFRKVSDIETMEHLLLRALCGVHIILAVMFMLMRIWPIFYSNIIAICLYLYFFKIVFKKWNDSSYARMMSLFWIIQFHSLWATVYLGWEYDFYMYCVCTMPVAMFVFYLVRGNAETILNASVSDLCIFAILVSIRSISSNFSYNWLPDNNYYHVISSSFTVFCCTVMMVFFSTLMVERLLRAGNDIKKKTEELDFLANYDMLTKLRNRRNLETKVRAYMENMKNDETMKLTMTLGDIDDFKKINDGYGHVCGDMVLSRIGEILNEYEKQGLISGRWGGEEILIVCKKEYKESFELVESLRKRIDEEAFVYEGRKVKVSMTFGIREILATDNYDSALAEVDERLYYGKTHGKNQVR